MKNKNALLIPRLRKILAAFVDSKTLRNCDTSEYPALAFIIEGVKL
jgi:hypothetical protein